MADDFLALLSAEAAGPPLPTYGQALALSERLGELVVALLPEGARVRAGRGCVEALFAAPSAEVSGLLSRVQAQLADALPGRQVTIAAVACDTDPSAAQLAAADALLRRARTEQQPLLVAAADPAGRTDERLMADLRQALAGDGLALHYQSKLDARTGALAGCEALLRWTHPTLGAVSPGQFVPLAEASGDIGALTSWVVARAIDDQARMAAAGHPFVVHVNISAPLLADPAFCAALLHQVAGHTATIGFEITESCMIADPEATLVRLRTFAAAGIRLAIDDYGTGFSSLAYLQRLPVHELKIDRSFVTELQSSARDPLLVRSTINLAHALEMQVTAEGVETAAALALLQVMGCDLIQGFFVSRPLPLDQFLIYAAAHDAQAALPRPTSLRERLATRRAQAGIQP